MFLLNIRKIMDYPNTNASLRLIEEPTNKKKQKKKIKNMQNALILKLLMKKILILKILKKKILILKLLIKKIISKMLTLIKLQMILLSLKKKTYNYQREPCCNCRLCCENFVYAILILLYIIFILNPIAQIVLNIIMVKDTLLFYILSIFLLLYI